MVDKSRTINLVAFFCIQNAGRILTVHVRYSCYIKYSSKLAGGEEYIYMYLHYQLILLVFCGTKDTLLTSKLCGHKFIEIARKYIN